jgi:NTP pyrophosphatase (non-canonical NTP hydrolase)
MNIEDVFHAIREERRYQKIKWGHDKQQSLAGYMLIMSSELQEAINAWMKNETGARQTCLEELLQVVAVGVACLETYGIKGCSRSTLDVTEDEMLEERRVASDLRFGSR